MQHFCCCWWPGFDVGIPWHDETGCPLGPRPLQNDGTSNHTQTSTATIERAAARLWNIEFIDASKQGITLQPRSIQEGVTAQLLKFQP
ncbi:MAG: hypothetical protein JOY79_08270 [Acidobacteriaceae bacterium]|nr:hypothetical protein [Acidobacteriaceae bacterium]